VEIIHPGGSGSFMNAGAYALNGDKTTTIKDLGDWWIKTVTRAVRDAENMVLTARRLTDWWKATNPADVGSQETETDTILVLSLAKARAELVIDTTLSDEKGQVTYRQVFTRQ
jgi:hypothetical protein